MYCCFMRDGYECILGDCICINDINANGICDEDEQQDVQT